jgi:hypothetical protein
VRAARPGSTRRRLRARSPWVLLAAFFVADAWRLRARARSLALTTDDDVASANAPNTESADLEYGCVQASGVDLDEQTLYDASRYARTNGLDVLDLVPADLATENALNLLRQVDPSTYTPNPLAPGRGPGQATLVHRTVLSRAGLSDGDRLDAETYVRTTAELKKFAPTRTGLAITPGLAANADARSSQRARLVATHHRTAPLVAAFPMAQLGLLGLGVALAPPWGLLALASYCAQPYLVTAGTGLRPGDRSPLRALSRPLRRAADAVDLVRVSRHELAKLTAAERLTGEHKKTEYRALIGCGVDRFFEARRETCPLCGGVDIVERLRTKDLLQCKPGTFVLDECTSCGHIFQNPRLTPEGLDFYYRDFYDGVGVDPTEFAWTADDRS